jgi:hypothetical protein
MSLINKTKEKTDNFFANPYVKVIGLFYMSALLALAFRALILASRGRRPPRG